MRKIFLKTFWYCISFSLFFGPLLTRAKFTYPLPYITKPACRTLTRNQAGDECKIQLPRIVGGNYNAYATNPFYRSIYSVLRGGTYDNGRDVKRGSHPGVDIATSLGTPVTSIGDGIVVDVGNKGGRGYYVVIKHQVFTNDDFFASSGNQNENSNIKYPPEEFYSIYAHLGYTLVQAGQRVSLGQIIGNVGESGKTTGPHLHFQIDRHNAPQHPYWYSNCQEKYKQDLWGIVNNGYCRDDMQRWTIDPIVFIESQGKSLGDPSYDIITAKNISKHDIFLYEINSFLSHWDLTYTINSWKLAYGENIPSAPPNSFMEENNSFIEENTKENIEKEEDQQVRKYSGDNMKEYPHFLISPYNLTILTLSRKSSTLKNKILLPKELTIHVTNPDILDVYPSTINYIGPSRNIYLIPKVFTGNTLIHLRIGKKEIYTAYIHIGNPPSQIVSLGSGSLYCKNINKITVCIVNLIDTTNQPILNSFWTGSIYIIGNKPFFAPQTLQEYLYALNGKIPEKKFTTDSFFTQYNLLLPGKIILIGKKGLKVQLHINSTKPTED